jgi:hypothetical protein
MVLIKLNLPADVKKPGLLASSIAMVLSVCLINRGLTMVKDDSVRVKNIAAINNFL